MGGRPLTSLLDASVSACAAEALHLVRTRAYFANRVDWEAVTRDVTRAAARADTELRLVLSPLWRALRDGHSHLVPARAVASNAERRSRLPVGRLSGGLGYIRLPEF